MKGPNTLNDIYENLIKFRSYEVALMYDLTKAYNSMETDQVERHVHRFWMRLNVEDPWEIWGFDCVQFGDRPAAALLSVAVEKASDNWQEVADLLNLDPEKVRQDSIKLREDNYVDDGNTGGSIEDVDRMQGIKNEQGEFTGTIPSMYRSVGLKLKTMVRSGSTDEQESAKLSGKVLGYGWNPEEDLMSVSLKFNISKK